MQLEDVGYMYKYLGVLPLEDPAQYAGGVKALALSNKYGVLCCGLGSGECPESFSLCNTYSEPDLTS